MDQEPFSIRSQCGYQQTRGLTQMITKAQEALVVFFHEVRGPKRADGFSALSVKLGRLWPLTHILTYKQIYWEKNWEKSSEMGR